jgi:TonB family protein
MKKDDGISILLSIIINIIIVLLIPSLSANKVENKKIKIGLVAYENKNRTKLEGQKNSNTSQKKTAEELKKIPPKKEVTKVEKPVEKKQEVKKQEVKKEEKKTTPKSDKIDLSALNNIASSVSVPKVEVMTSVQPKSSGYREVAVLEISKKELQSGVTSKNKASENITLSKELISAENEKLELNDEDKIAFNSEIGKDSSFDRILQISGETEGLPSGYRLGTEDGDIVARWDTSNREPVYPESAQLKGLHGSVKIRMNIDENGNVKTLKLEKGSGVPEINNAIEEVGRTWKIYLSKNGLSVKGDVILEYNFTLKGKVN